MLRIIVLLIIVSAAMLTACQKGDQPSAGSPATKSEGAPADKPAEAPVDKPTEAPVDKPVEAPVDKPTEAPVDKPTEAPADKPAEAPADKPAEAPADKPAEAPADKPTEPEALGFPHLPATEVLARQARFVPTRLAWDKSLLDEKEAELVRTLVRAARAMDHLFWVQASADGLQWRERLAQVKTPEARALFHFLMTNYGAFDRLNSMEPFLGDKPKPMGANYYPPDLTVEEFDKWIADHPGDAEALGQHFTVIRRVGDELKAVPYSEEYKRELDAAARLLEQAATLTDNASLKTYLQSRAQAFRSNDYYQSDVDWMDLDSKVEVTIGPYEVYEDRLFGYKAAFEAFVTVRDPVETKKLEVFQQWLDRMERNLPIPDEHKNFKRGSSSPLLVVDEIFTAGDTRAGVQTLAFNLPNDERVREKKGSKKVILRNVGAAKFQKILTPIAGRVLSEPLVLELNEEAYFSHTLLHEIAHGLGPGTIKAAGAETTVNLALKDIYPAVEEAKADILGLYNALFLIDKGVLKLADVGGGKTDRNVFLEPAAARRAVLTTFLAGIFRSTRFGVEEAHGKANLVLFNYLIDKGGIIVDEAGRFGYDEAALVAGITDCAHDILMLEATGDYEGSKAFVARYAEVREAMGKALAGLQDLPVDIEPIYDLP
ncbi:MAG: peptidase [Deltaproteobacteria bacterium]|nr:peptidase [Deltaproteobacteria bacterium]